MKPTFKRISKDELGILIAFSAFLFGGWARIYTAISAGFPINDGGMFYKMTQVIQQNGFRVPAYFVYNGQNIPYAYPPLAFFITAGINYLLGIPLLDIFQFLPAIILVGTIPVFYGLANAFLGDKLQAGIATLLFALTPRSITWFIMGGGITRSMGLLFLMLAVKYLYLIYRTPSSKNLNFSIIFCVLVVLTHPEAAFHTAAIALLLWMYYDRTRRGFWKTVIISSATFVLTAGWWLPLIHQIGFDPFITASQTGMNSTAGFLYPFVHFNDEPFITFIMVFGFLGMMTELASRRYILILFYFLPFIVELRNAGNVAILPLALLGSSAICNLILPGLQKIISYKNKLDSSSLYPNWLLLCGFCFISIYLLSAMQFHAVHLANQHVSKLNREAMEWIKKYTLENSVFLVLTGYNDPIRDWTSEWFPALTERVSLTTVQGREWIKEENFVTIIGDYQKFQNCLNSTTPLVCISEETIHQGFKFDYIYVGIILMETPNRTAPRVENLIFQLLQSDDYISVYDTDAVIIFEYSDRPQ